MGGDDAMISVDSRGRHPLIGRLHLLCLLCFQLLFLLLNVSLTVSRDLSRRLFNISSNDRK